MRLFSGGWCGVMGGFLFYKVKVMGEMVGLGTFWWFSVVR